MSVYRPNEGSRGWLQLNQVPIFPCLESHSILHSLSFSLYTSTSIGVTEGPASLLQLSTAPAVAIYLVNMYVMSRFTRLQLISDLCVGPSIDPLYFCNYLSCRSSCRLPSQWKVSEYYGYRQRHLCSLLITRLWESGTILREALTSSEVS